MTRPVYDLLLSLVGSFLEKAQCIIGPEERLFITLLYLAHGDSFQTIAWRYKVRNIVLETCEILWSVLSPVYLSEPSQSQYGDIATDFKRLWNIPNFVGAVDGKLIAIVRPNNFGSMFFNYKKFYSVVLMATCDARYTFTSVDVGSYGSQSDGGFLRSSPFGASLMQNTLPLPPDAPLWSGAPLKFPFFFVGDAAFSLRSNLMRPYPGTNLPEGKETFNYRLSRARRTIENSFGILAARWRILRSVIECSPENTDIITLACLVLHNFVMLNDTRRWYCPDRYADWENAEHELQQGGWQTELANVGGSLSTITSTYRNAACVAFGLRDKLAHYYLN